MAVAAVGDPVDRLDREWTEFKETGARYDYYRVALDLFAENPVTGIGADNFAQDYRERGRVGERPTSPHSLELRDARADRRRGRGCCCWWRSARLSRRPSGAFAAEPRWRPRWRPAAR